ncbi:MAG: hypothetical protein JSU61_07680 [Fidelibacterota bacterium]|nr:MAG: hypothetical protein JSU61_07680 [Candidatus Neomarinimicrobiota bacterium]
MYRSLLGQDADVLGSVGGGACDAQDDVAVLVASGDEQRGKAEGRYTDTGMAHGRFSGQNYRELYINLLQIHNGSRGTAAYLKEWFIYGGGR